jgi:cyanophycin synthetase
LFDRVVIYEDRGRRGRAPGEMTSLIRAALTEARAGSYCESAGRLEQAVARGLALAAGSGPVLIVYEKLAPVQQLLAEHGAERGAPRLAMVHGGR